MFFTLFPLDSFYSCAFNFNNLPSAMYNLANHISVLFILHIGVFIFRSLMWVFLNIIYFPMYLFNHIKFSYKHVLMFSANSSICMSFLGQFQWIYFFHYETCFLPLCLPINLWFDARHCDFTLMAAGYYYISINIPKSCSMMQLIYLEIFLSFWVLLLWFVSWFWSSV